MVIDGDNVPSPVEIGLTDLPNIGGTPGTSGFPIPAYLGRANDKGLLTSYGTVVRDFESEAKTRCNFQFR